MSTKVVEDQSGTHADRISVAHFVKLFEGYHNREKSDSNNNPSDENKAKEMHLTTHYCFLLLANWVK